MTLVGTLHSRVIIMIKSLFFLTFYFDNYLCQFNLTCIYIYMCISFADVHRIESNGFKGVLKNLN